jgi:hypothetical protein
MLIWNTSGLIKFKERRFKNDHIFRICQILGKEMGINCNRTSAVYIECKKAYDSVRKVLYNIIIEFSIPMKLVRIIKI